MLHFFFCISHMILCCLFFFFLPPLSFVFDMLIIMTMHKMKSTKNAACSNIENLTLFLIGCKRVKFHISIIFVCFKNVSILTPLFLCAVYLFTDDNVFFVMIPIRLKIT
eukprot:63690_1